MYKNIQPDQTRYEIAIQRQQQSPYVVIDNE